MQSDPNRDPNDHLIFIETQPSRVLDESLNILIPFSSIRRRGGQYTWWASREADGKRRRCHRVEKDAQGKWVPVNLWEP